MISVTSHPKALAMRPTVAGLHVPRVSTLQTVGTGISAFSAKVFLFNSDLTIAISNLLLLILNFFTLFQSFS